MLRRILSVAVFSAVSVMTFAQAPRSVDGTQNNLSNAEWGSTEEQMPRISSYGYADGISEPGGAGLPNPRILSNVIFAQDSSLLDQMNLSDYVWVFGQFMDHDVVLVENDPTEPASIAVDFEDEYFNPGGVFQGVQIHMSRSKAVAGTGTSISNPREHQNHITSWIDASNVYGSDMDRANWLRTFSDGKMKTSAGNLLPYNTVDGEYDSSIDPNAPGMDNENPFVSKLFVAGDARANENALLTCVHTLFVREHNRLCDILQAETPSLNDEALYQKARKLVGAYIQAITYEEWLPAMGISLDNYAGYNPTINPTISNEFSAAAFRLGHTLLNGDLHIMDNDGNDLGSIALKDAFFTPSLVNNLGLDVFFKGMAEQVEQEMDAKIVDDVRNFLFGPPTSGVGGLDLAAININRGRERGLPSFNTIRADLGLTPYANIEEFCPVPETTQVLVDHYGNINFIDAWVGMLLEEHMPGMLFGETIMHIMMQQFGDLRDGDRFYYEIDGGFNATEVAEIKNTTFRDIIMRNTGVTIMQENVFEAMPHDSICMADGPFADINGAIQTWNGLNIGGVEMTATNVTDATTVSATTSLNGAFLLEDAEACEHYIVTPVKNTDHANGITTNDLVKIIKHILETEYLDSPYKIIAADANNDGNVTVGDVVELRKLILFLSTEIPNNTSWRFVDADYDFIDPTDPLAENFPEYNDLSSASDMLEDLNFVALKVGDMNGSANPDLIISEESEVKTDETLAFYAINKFVKAGEIVQLPIRSTDIKGVNGFQFTLAIDPTVLKFDAVLQQALPALSASNFNYLEKEGQLLVSWNGDASELLENEVLFVLQFEALKSGTLNELIQLNSSKILAEAYDKNSSDDIMNVALYFDDLEIETELPNDFSLLQNQPNPFRDNTIIGFQLPGDSEVTLSINDITGRLLYETTVDFSKGYQQFEIDASMLPQAASGILYYKVATEFGTATRKMTNLK